MLGYYIIEVSTGKTCIGYAVSKEFDWYEERKCEALVAKRVLEIFGFCDTDEYINAFPGTYDTKSKQFTRWLGIVPERNASQQDNFFIMGISTRCVNSLRGRVERNIENQYKESMMDDCADVFTIPLKIDEVRQSCGMKSVPKKRLWYCEDWVES